MLGVGERVVDDDLQNILAGRKVVAEQEPSGDADAAQIELHLRPNGELFWLPIKDQLPVAKDLRLDG